MRTVRRLLLSKSRDIWSVTPETTVYDAIKLMAEKDIGAVMVLEQGQLVGIMSERDYLQKVVLHGHSSKETLVGDIMTKRILYVRPEQTIDECMALMTEKHLRHLPVLDDGRLVGVVSMRDVIAKVIADKEFLIGQLENYITEQRSWRGAMAMVE